MSKFYGKVGYVETIEYPENSGVWVEDVQDRPYYGDVIRNISRRDNNGSVNDNLQYSNQISIIADPYAYSHFSSIAYVWLHGARWKVTSIEERRPRLILNIGGVYNDGE